MAPRSKRDRSHKPRNGGEGARYISQQVTTASASISPETQQRLLNIFSNTLANVLQSDLSPVLQEIKGYLYKREFAAAFGKAQYLEAYAARWSASRCLGYLNIFWTLIPQFWQTKRSEKIGEAPNESVAPSRNVACIGGGAGAELVALAGMQNLLASAENEVDQVNDMKLNIVAVDIADWSTIIHGLRENITNSPSISKYASAVSKAANVPLVGARSIEISFQQQDILTAHFGEILRLISNIDLVTLMFTLNELYSVSVSSTQRFLLSLKEIMKPGSLLLVVDSPGSYSTVSLNGMEKQYPMQWLLDHTMINQAPFGNRIEENVEAAWVKLHEDQSHWFRLSSELKYPIGLENMRTQIHLYQRL